MPHPLPATPRCRTTLSVAAVTAAVLALSASGAAAQEVTFITPVAGVTSINGLRATLTYEPLEQFGYQRLNLRVEAAKPANADRQITVRFYGDRGVLGQDSDRYDTAVEQDAELPAGAKRVELALTVPKLHDWGIIRWELWVDGVRDPALSGVRPQSNLGGGPRIELFAPQGLRDQRPINFYRGVTRERGSEPYFGGLGPELVAVLDSEPLPSDWRLLESYHAVVVSAEKLADAAEQDPAGLAALQRWLCLGGRLLVEDAGDDFERLDRIDQMLAQSAQPFDKQLARVQQDEVRDQTATKEEIAPRPGADGQDEQDELADEAPPPFSEHPAWRWGRLLLPVNAVDQEASEAEAPSEPRGRRRRVETDAWFLECPIGFGVATAFPGRIDDLPQQSPTTGRQGDPLAASPRWLMRSVSRRLAQMDWRERHGMVPNRGAAEFANWLVPGVGAAPVDAFRWMITLFVLLVGPASFFFLRAYHRTQLMALTAPLAAAAFTLGLFAYATLSDGIGLRVRSRSLTFIDQHSQQACSWSRQSYYAGLAPAEGLTFPRSAAVYPTLPPWDMASRDPSNPYMREVLLSDNTQQLSRGWLASRDTSQLLVLDGGPATARLEVDATGDGVRAVNRLGVELDQLLVLDREARWWVSSGLDSGAEVELEPTTRRDVVELVRNAFFETAPSFPVGIGADDSGRQNTLLGPVRARDRRSNSTPDSFLEGRLAMLLSDIEGRNDGLTAALKPGSYLALSSKSTCAPIGHADARELGSFHVTVGVWEATRP
ncbi:hypothetical protein Pla123a_47040 [Posidoniimonas polymericola]|uniref:DUF4159 domain-containing protein n=1 Tax=Posidoniimonas polymericola TaxID=2528002 RepID=A0A5C5XTQ1_9BACT|nr:hypothetical protein [Posidoniimonas polymericola]TWT66310.1 hypothetical protein Pla123a_47040 [Posidoniimonas polymericola]